MFRRSTSLAFAATPINRYWVADDDDPRAPDTTFKNLKPSFMIRWWRQIKQRCVRLWVFDEAANPEVFTGLHNPWNDGNDQNRFEQIVFLPGSSYGHIPNSYADPFLYNQRSSSAFRWNYNNPQGDVRGHWHLDHDDLMRIKSWRPKTNSPFEVPPTGWAWHTRPEETVDEHGDRIVKQVFDYSTFCATCPYPVESFRIAGMGYLPNYAMDRVEIMGFKQGELLRADEDEERIVRRQQAEADLEWERVKKTEIIQEPWMYPGQVRQEDFRDSLARAKKKWRENVKAGRPTDPTLDPDYDLVQASEYVEPKDSDRAEWRHLWFSNRTGSAEDKKLGKDLMYQYSSSADRGLEDAESGHAQPYPGFNEDVAGGAKYTRTTQADGTPLHDQTKAMPGDQQNLRVAPPGFDIDGNMLPDWKPPMTTIDKSGRIIPNTYADGTPVTETPRGGGAPAASTPVEENAAPAAAEIPAEDKKE